MDLEMNDDRETVPEIERSDTLVRIVYSLLFWLVMGVVRGLVGVIVVFQLLWALITADRPPERVRELAHRLVAYSYRIGRYLTYNEACPPFPFSDFPALVEPPEELDSEEN